MGRKAVRGFDPGGRAARLLAVLLALLIWQGAALLLGNPLLLVTPLAAAARLGELALTGAFWKTVGYSFLRIAGGFLLALAVGFALAVPAGRRPFLAALLRPWMVTVQAVPVASFIILAFLWLSSRRLSVFIAFLMVLPVIYNNVLQGVRGADPALLEVAALYRAPWPRQFRYIYLPALRPYLTAGCRVGLGLCWKAGVAAEVIGVCAGSVGERLYDAKVYLEMADLFAWTAVIVLVSVGFEKLFLALLGRALDRWEGA